jgi:CheY-like chemotaxis protein
MAHRSAVGDPGSLGRVVRHFLYFDDSADDRRRYSGRLRSADLEIVAFAPPPDLALAMLGDKRWDLFLVDYELMGVADEGLHSNYRGGTLAITLKERARDVPVVLFTRQGLQEWQADRRLFESIRIFDDIVFKGDVETNPDDARDRLLRVAIGFEDLRNAGRDWGAASARIGATPDEESQLKEAGPPIEGGNWEVAELAKWLHEVILTYPGILYDRVHTAAALGLSLSSFESEGVQALVEAALYSGPLAPREGRWWRPRLIRWASELIATGPRTGPIFETLRLELERELGSALEPSACVHCGETPADSVCYVLNEPVRTQHSLAYFPDSRPAIMDTARVSFKAIRDSNLVNEELIDANGQDLVRAIQEGRFY